MLKQAQKELWTGSKWTLPTFEGGEGPSFPAFLPSTHVLHKYDFETGPEGPELQVTRGCRCNQQFFFSQLSAYFTVVSNSLRN
jgi:hypothetical protein